MIVHAVCPHDCSDLERLYHSEHLLYPQIRVGAKGAGKFRRTTWDEALGLIAARLQSIIDSPEGPQMKQALWGAGVATGGGGAEDSGAPLRTDHMVEVARA